MCKCTFCKIIKKEIPAYIIYENSVACVILDIDPINEGHILILPKIHVDSLDKIPEDMLFEITKLVQKMIKVLRQVYKFDGYTIMQNGNEFCDYGHLHIHIIPRYQNDGFRWECQDKEYNQLEEVACKIKKAL